MNSKNKLVLNPNASAAEKIAYIRRLARLDNQSLARSAQDFPSSLFREAPVGRGYNIFGAFADNESVQGQVLDFAKLTEDGLVSSTPINDSETLIVSGNTLQEVSESMSASVSASLSGGFGPTSFSGSMSASFAGDTMFRHEYSYANLYQLHRVARVKLFPDTARLRDGYMTPMAADLINDTKVEASKIIDFFGTHVLFDAVYGARFEYSSATNTWAYEVKTSASASIEASFTGATASGSASSESSLSKEEQEYEQSSSTRVRAAGGDSELAGSLENIDAWRATINDHDPVLVQFMGDQPLVPIWQFARHEDRRQELAEAVKAISDGIQSVINGDQALDINCQIKCLNASDEGGGNLELMGAIDMELLDGNGNTVWSAHPFKVSHKGPYVVLKKNQVHRCPKKTASIKGAEDTTRYMLRFTTQIDERDPGSSGDDDLGRQVQELRFVGSRLLGDHVVHSKNNILELKFNVALAD